MVCPKCNIQIEEGKSICPHCGNTISINNTGTEILVPPSSRAITCQKYGLISISINLIDFVILSITLYLGISEIAFFALLFIPIGIGLALGTIICGIIELVAINRKKSTKLGRKYVIQGIVLGLVSIFLFVFFFTFLAESLLYNGFLNIRSKVSQAKGEQNMIATGLEAYYLDNKTYPMADEPRSREPKSYENDGTYASEGGIIPKILTTPIAYLTALPRDPFKLRGKGYYGYGSGRGPVNLIGTDNGKYLSEGGKPVLGTKGWIITSYGPDKVDGNSGIKSGAILREEVEWTDNIDTTQPLINKGLTYDPTNGIISPGDIWRRGP
jgi:hypothetical protein